MKGVTMTMISLIMATASRRSERFASSFHHPSSVVSNRHNPRPTLHRATRLGASTSANDAVSSTLSTTSTSTSSTTTNTFADSSIYAQDADALSKLQSRFLQTMRDRGFLHQCTGITELDALLVANNNSTASDSGKNTTTPTASVGRPVVSAYLGFDATADSLHVGSLLQIMILRHWQQAGHRPVVLVGGGTSKVGDPTGKDESRVILTTERIDANIRGISSVFDRFLTFVGEEEEEENRRPSDAILVNNNDWLSELKYLDFLREYGTHFTINRMLSFESVKQRLEREAPFSFLEFNYMILQAYDFLELYRRHGTILQLGGSDQWGNMVSGTELGRRCAGAQLFALTAPLITTSDGKKMGKTANGAVWLNADRMSEYDYWQFWRNTNDADVIRFLKLFTELPLTEIAQLEQLQGADINRAKMVLADEATTLLHGSACLTAIRETAGTLFAGAGSSTEGLPRAFVSKAALVGSSNGGVSVLDLLVELQLASSKKEARRLILGGGARLNDKPISTTTTDDAAVAANTNNPMLRLEDFEGAREVTLRAGKKRAGVIELVV